MRIQVTSKKAAKYIADFLIKHGWPETRKGASLEEVVHFALCAFREFTKTKDEVEDDLPRHRPV